METRSPVAGSDVPVASPAVVTSTPRTTKLAAVPPDAAVNDDTAPSNSTVAPAVCTGRWSRLSATVAVKAVAGRLGAVVENADTTSPTANALAHAADWPCARHVAPARLSCRPPMVTPGVALVAVTTPSTLYSAPAEPVGVSWTETSVATMLALPLVLLNR